MHECKHPLAPSISGPSRNQHTGASTPHHVRSRDSTDIQQRSGLDQANWEPARLAFRTTDTCAVYSVSQSVSTASRTDHPLLSSSSSSVSPPQAEFNNVGLRMDFTAAALPYARLVDPLLVQSPPAIFRVCWICSVMDLTLPHQSVSRPADTTATLE
jgi:hypothetical protein